MSGWAVFMLVAALAAGCVLSGVAVRKLAAFARALPDPAWKPTGIRQLHEGYDESKALQASRDAARREARRRKIAAGSRRAPRAASVERIDAHRRRA